MECLLNSFVRSLNRGYLRRPEDRLLLRCWHRRRIQMEKRAELVLTFLIRGRGVRVFITTGRVKNYHNLNDVMNEQSLNKIPYIEDTNELAYS